MTWYGALSLMMGGLIVLLALGVPVAFAFLAINLVGALFFMGGEAGLGQLVRNFADSVTKIELAPIPLFLLMGELMYRSRMAEHAIDAVDRLISRVPGRLAVVAVTGGTIFSALSGSTIATTAMLGNTMLPDMLKRGYKPVMAMGPIMAIGGVDMLIPPSALTVLLATLASGMATGVRMGVAEMLIAGILPGLIMSVLFIAYIVGRCALDPTLAPTYAAARYSVRDRVLPFVKYVLPLFLIVVVVIGSMFAGIASPTDSAALGCSATVLVALAYRSLSVKALVKALTETALVTVMILFIIGASVSFAQIISLSGATDGALGAIGGLPFSRLEFILCMIAILLVLGCFVDQVSMMLLTLPFFMPLVAKLGIDPIWFGCLFLISMQVGLLSPPFGLLLFVMKGVAPPNTAMADVTRAALPFIVMMLGVLALVLIVPGVATWLPGLISR
ncbi:MAG: TRAP transporter large permease [Alphaproteobacteria bacterium]